MWQQGDIDAATRWLASLDAADQAALRRSMQTQRTLAPIYNAVNRTIDVVRRTSRSLSEGAQSLVSQTQQYGREAAAWAGRTGAELADRAADLRDRAGVTAEVAAIRVSDGLDSAGRAINAGATATRDALATGATATRDAVATGAAATRDAVATGAAATRGAVVSGATATRDAVVSGATATRDAAVAATQATGRASVRAGQGIAAAAGRASRWFQAKISNGVGRTSAGLEAMRQFKDPNLAGQPSQSAGELSPNAITATAAQVHAFATAGSRAERQAALNSLVGSMDKDNQAMLMAALINSGQAPAAGAVNATPAQTQSGPSATKGPEKGPDLGK